MNESTVNNPILKENESTRAILAGVDTTNMMRKYLWTSLKNWLKPQVR
ncbi:MAG: hypothetical protein ACLS48_03725 [[Eubacterium] siraeum]